MRVAGSLHWLHCAATKEAVYYTIHKKRGTEGMDDAGILPNFTGAAIHDHLKAYYKYTNCAHGECNAHHLRKLIFISDVLGQEWAKEMLGLLMRIKTHVDYSRLFGADRLPKEDLEGYEGMYSFIIVSAADASGVPNPYGVGESGGDCAVTESKQNGAEPELAPDGHTQSNTGETTYRTDACDTAAVDNHAEPHAKKKRRKKTESELMLIRLAQYEQETLMFMYDFNVPFDNNLTESAIRMPKLHQKIAGCFRTKEGADVFARIRTFIGTTKKKGKNIMDGIRAVLDGHGVDFLYPGRG
jgi:transposase